MAARRTAGSQGCPLPAPRWSRSNRFSTSELLGYGLDLLVPIKDAVTADGDVIVTIDAETFGRWLKAAFGGPATSDVEPYTHPYTHEFRSGSWSLTSIPIETEMPRFAMCSGFILDQLSGQDACVTLRPSRWRIDGIRWPQ